MAELAKMRGGFQGLAAAGALSSAALAFVLGCAARVPPPAAPPAAVPTEVPTAIHGRVLDANWRPVGGARVTLSTDERGEVGAGVSGADGWFTFPLAGYTGQGEDPILAVDADGFHHWQQRILKSSLGDCRARLDRRLDEAFFAALGALSDPAERAARVNEILAADDWERMLSSAFPHLGELRQDLIGASARPPADPDDQRADTALTLLAFWNDPRDRQRLAPWARKHPVYELSPERVQSPELEGFCQAWAAVHFAHEHVKGGWPPYFCREPVVDAGRTHALLLFEVRYAHWRYNLYLVAAREGEGRPWTLRMVVQNMIT